MHDTGDDAERVERFDAADSEQQLLPDPDAFVASIQPRGELAILGPVAVDVRIEQQQRVAAHRQFPDTRRDGSRPRVDLDDERGPLGERRLQRQQAAIHVDVVLVLPPVAIEPLPEISLVVIQAHADERDPEIGRALEVISGQDAEAAGIDRNGLVEPELGGEVRHQARAEHAGVPRAPRSLRRQIFLQTPICVIDSTVQGQLRRAVVQRVHLGQLQQRDRVVIELPPQ